MFKKMSNILILSVIFSIIFVIDNSSTFAANTNSDLLYEKAKLGISDLTTEEMQDILDNIDVELMNSSLNTTNKFSQLNNMTLSTNTESYSTAEILEVSEDSQLIAIHTFSDISLNEVKKGNDTISPLWTQDLEDHTISVRAKMTLVVDAKSYLGASMLRLKQGYGSWSILDSRVKSITNRNVGFANGGLGEKGKPIGESYGPYFLTTNSFNKNLNGSYVSKDSGYTILGTMTSTLSTNSSSWNFKMVLRFGEPASKS